MAEITLSDYCDEIEALIEQEAYDEAIAHCRHILKHHPKYLPAYQLMGKAALEKKQYEEAVNLFQRVLSVNPEDFVSYVALSIIQDQAKALPEAVWYMERAFELAPDNEVIIEELRNLYGRRDGKPPDRVPLTRGALARLYLRGHLYDRAIEELRALLSDHPDRVDLQAALLEALWRDGRRIEAEAIALELLERLPNCLKAHLLLGDLWSFDGRGDEGAKHLRLAEAFDPEHRVAQELLGDLSPLPVQEVTIERLVYTPPVEALPTEEAPEWMVGLPTEEAAPAVSDWLQEVAAAAEVEVPPTEEEAPSAEMPDWLAEITAEEELLPPLEPSEIPGAEEAPSPMAETVPDWLQELTSAPEVSTEEEAAPAEEVPDWLADLVPGEI
ncbi:MAG TPA: tetratricopeptide repeat protein, partial [Chloroflexi bacterium]|nr:tetratricopeptide repeat protein [Chloroflexota bacterium]